MSTEPLQQKPQIIALCGPSGGGQSHLTLNLAAELSLCTPRVLVIDADPQNSIAQMMHLPSPALASLEANHHTLGSAVIHRMPLLSCVTTSSPAFIFAGEQIPPQELSLATRLHSKLALEALAGEVGQLRDHFQFILIDCGPSLTALTSALLWSTDICIVPSRLRTTEEPGLSNFLRQLREAKRMGPPHPYSIGLLTNRPSEAWQDTAHNVQVRDSGYLQGPAIQVLAPIPVDESGKLFSMENITDPIAPITLTRRPPHPDYRDLMIRLRFHRPET
jgi:chromosome partitioning protein